MSATHIAYGSIRMEPVFMILGQSAATAAIMALEEGISALDAKLNDPSFYASGTADSASQFDLLAAKKAELESKVSRWAELEEIKAACSA